MGCRGLRERGWVEKAGVGGEKVGSYAVKRNSGKGLLSGSGGSHSRDGLGQTPGIAWARLQK
eukprot:scaffold2060_cov62-Isochrysis_galbana.AAC.1